MSPQYMKILENLIEKYPNFKFCTLISLSNSIKAIIISIKMSPNNTCCCCWESFGVNKAKKSLEPATPRTEELMKLYIFPGFSLEVEDFPKQICTTCARNLFFLNSGQNNRSSWGEKVSKVK